MSNLGKKVVLTAFNGRLRSAPMEWPESKIGEDIYLIMDMEKPSVVTGSGGIKEYDSMPKKARFEFSGGFSSQDELPAIYKLVEVL